MAGQNSINSGYLPDTYDANDIPYTYEGPSLEVPLNRVNLLETKKSWLDDVYDQSTSSSCVANATAVAIRFLAHKSDLVKSNDPAADPSRLFIYYNARVLPMLLDQDAGDRHWPKRAEIEDNGSETRDAMKSINLWGVAPNKEWGWALGKQRVDNKKMKTSKLEDIVVDINSRPKKNAYDTAKFQKVVQYCRLDPDHPTSVEETMTYEERVAVGTITLARLKLCLTEGYPVVFGFYWYYDSETGWTAAPSGDPELTRFSSLPTVPLDRRHRGPLPDEDGNTDGHTVVAIGFDNDRPVFDVAGKPIKCRKIVYQGEGGDKKPEIVDEVEKGAVLIQDSYRGERERWWMPYSYITDWEASNDYWMIRRLRTPRPPPLANPQRQTTITLNKPWTVVRTVKEVRLSPTPMSSIAASLSDSASVIAYVLESGAICIDSYGMSPNQNGTYSRILASSAAEAAQGPTAHSPYWAFWTTTSGGLNGYFYQDKSTRQRGKEELFGPGTVARDGGIVALATVENPASVWWVTPQGGIKGAWLPKDDPRAKWTPYELAGEKAAATTSGIAAIQDVTHPGSVDLFWAGPNGTIQHHWKTGDGLKWIPNAVERAPMNPAAPASHIAVVSRGPGMLDVIYVAADGSLQWLTWEEDNPQKQWVVKKIAEKMWARVDTDLKVVMTNAKRVDVYFVSTDDGLYVVPGRLHWLSNTLQWKEPVEIGAEGTVAAGTPLGVWPTDINWPTEINYRGWSVMFRDPNGNAVVAEWKTED